MNETVHVELSKKQRDVLLQGLRFVRSSLMLEVADPTPEHTAQRAARLREVADLVAQLNRSPAEPATVDV